MNILGKTSFDFMGKRKIALVVSAILAIIGFAAIMAVPLGKANLGTDFAGGLVVNYRFEKPVRIEDARKALESGGYKDADLQEFSEPNKLLVRVKRGGDVKGVEKAIGDIFKASMPENPYAIDLISEVGPTVGKKLQKDALYAIAISMLGILIYVAWRFEFRFGVAAVIATLHDVLAVMAIFLVLNKELNLLVITALLTVAGYSLTDTVVVFDRIRENLKKGAKEELIPLINRSINEVLSRTIVTSGTTALATIALFVAGGEVIHDFSLALLLGIVVGTYSSIFVASPLLLIWKKAGGLIKT
ncbi:MAG: protein translocase subunit SecF [Thermodesulfobacteriota bacterium]